MRTNPRRPPPLGNEGRKDGKKEGGKEGWRDGGKEGKRKCVFVEGRGRGRRGGERERKAS